MAKITVTLTAQYDDGKIVKEPGDTISMEEKQARQLAALGMLELPVKEAKAPRGKVAKIEPVVDNGDDDPRDLDAHDIDARGLDPDAMGQDGE